MFHYEQYITYNNIERSDNRIFTKESFKVNPSPVPIVVGDWDYANVIGFAELENRDEGVYAKCSFFDTDLAKETAVMLIDRKELTMSFRAYHVKHDEDGKTVIGGRIRVLIPIPLGTEYTYQVKMEV